MKDDCKQVFLQARMIVLAGKTMGKPWEKHGKAIDKKTKVLQT